MLHYYTPVSKPALRSPGMSEGAVDEGEDSGRYPSVADGNHDPARRFGPDNRQEP